jgi:hypothetical protein
MNIVTLDPAIVEENLIRVTVYAVNVSLSGCIFGMESA